MSGFKSQVASLGKGRWVWRVVTPNEDYVFCEAAAPSMTRKHAEEMAAEWVLRNLSEPNWEDVS